MALSSESEYNCELGFNLFVLPVEVYVSESFYWFLAARIWFNKSANQCNHTMSTTINKNKIECCLFSIHSVYAVLSAYLPYMYIVAYYW